MKTTSCCRLLSARAPPADAKCWCGAKRPVQSTASARSEGLTNQPFCANPQGGGSTVVNLSLGGIHGQKKARPRESGIYKGLGAGSCPNGIRGSVVARRTPPAFQPASC